MSVTTFGCKRSYEQEEKHMNWDQVEGNWQQFEGKVRERWGRFTDSDIDVIKGKRDKLVGRIQERYGIVREEAERQVNDFLGAFRG
jgi:uncharacterized protein YjbJ (UPF0337 family)